MYICACTVYARGRFVPEQKTEPIFNLGHCSWKLKQLIMKVVVDYAIGSISHHYIISEALNSFWQRYCIWYPSITYNSVAMLYGNGSWHILVWMATHDFFRWSVSQVNTGVHVFVIPIYLQICFEEVREFFPVNNNVSKKPCKFSGLEKKSPLVVQGFLV